MNAVIRAYGPADLPAMTAVWNEIVEEGVAFPQEDFLDDISARAFFAAQTHCGVAVDPASERLVGLYILHPNNVGRCGHIANASFAIGSAERGRGIGRALVLDCLKEAKAHGFRLMQFNAVVANNTGARRLYTQLGFRELGVIPAGFRMKDGHFEDIYPYIIEL